MTTDCNYRTEYGQVKNKWGERADISVANTLYTVSGIGGMANVVARNILVTTGGMGNALARSTNLAY